MGLKRRKEGVWSDDIHLTKKPLGVMSLSFLEVAEYFVNQHKAQRVSSNDWFDWSVKHANPDL